MTSQLDAGDLTKLTIAINAEEFSLWLRQWADRFPKLEHAVDDSRDSIYAGRGDVRLVAAMQAAIYIAAHTEKVDAKR